jgi:fluoride ion exporter CrcB/FEX
MSEIGCCVCRHTVQYFLSSSQTLAAFRLPWRQNFYFFCRITGGPGSALSPASEKVFPQRRRNFPYFMSTFEVEIYGKHTVGNLLLYFPSECSRLCVARSTFTDTHFGGYTTYCTLSWECLHRISLGELKNTESCTQTGLVLLISFSHLSFCPAVEHVCFLFGIGLRGPPSLWRECP